MSLVTINDTNLKNIANAIREKNGTTDTYKPNEMASAISNIEAGIEPTGTLDITENGNYDVTNYANANVNVASSGGESTYAPRWLKFTRCALEDLTVETQNVDTSNITDMESEFQYCEARALAPKFDVTNVTTMVNFMSNCGSLKTADLSYLRESAVTTMEYFCYNNSGLQTLDMRNLSTPKLNNMSYMVAICGNLTSINVSSLITNKVSNMQSTFYKLPKLTSLDLSNFNTENVTNMQWMFNGDTALTSLDLSSFYTPKLTNTKEMFKNCTSLTHIDMRNFVFTKVSTYTTMFSGVPTNCEIIVKDDTAKTWITSKFTDLTNVKTVAEL